MTRSRFFHTSFFLVFAAVLIPTPTTPVTFTPTFEPTEAPPVTSSLPVLPIETKVPQQGPCSFSYNVVAIEAQSQNTEVSRSVQEESSNKWSTIAEETVEIPAEFQGDYALNISVDSATKPTGQHLVEMEGTGVHRETIDLSECVAPTDGVPLFGIFEKLFSISGGGSNPYTSVEAKAELISPGGQRATIPLFWNGGKTFGLRFSPNERGLWSFNVTSNDSGLDGQKGQFQVTSSSNKGSIMQMKEVPYHFQYENGEPFFFWGETAWAGFINTSKQNSRSRFFDYVNVRAAQGYNVMTIQAYGNGGTRNEGGEPFTNFSNEIINVDYWKEVDKRIEYIGSKGIIPWIYMNWGGIERWGMFENQEARLRFIRYLVARYSAYPTGFTVSGEWTKEGPPSNENEVNEMGNEVFTSDPHGRMITVHVNSDLNKRASGSVEEFAKQNWMSFGDWKQDYLNLHQDMLSARDHNKPVVNSEYGYYRRNDCDGKIVKANSQDVQEYRNATWDIYMAGGYGVGGYGSTYYGGTRDCIQDKFVEEPTNNDWEEQQAYVWKFFKSLEWWKLTPTDNLISSAQSRTSDQMNHPNSTRQGFAAPPVRTFWALSDHNNTYVAYVRGLTSAASLDLRGTTGNFSVKRYNPRNGSFTEIGTTTGGAIISLAPPDDLDYVFLLQKLQT